MAFANSLSGLIAAGKAIDVIGNNIANAQTVGFKASVARFTNVQAAGKGGGAADSSASAGVSADNIVQDFAQGRLELSDNPLDMAISGIGFFRLQNTDTGKITYTRDGQFRLSFEADATGKNMAHLTTRSGLSLTGNLPQTDPVTGENIFAAEPNPTPLLIEPEFPPQATSAAQFSLNLDSRAQAPSLAFNPAISQSFNSSSMVTVYDATGTSHNLRAYFCTAGAGNAWSVYTTLDYDPASGSAPVVQGPQSLSFDTQGRLNTAMPLAAQSFATANGTLSIAIDFSGTSQLGIPFSINSIGQNGYNRGVIQDAGQFAVQSDGKITARYTNGQVRNVAQLVLANFANPNALINLGENQWTTNDDTVKGTGEIALGFPNFYTKKVDNFQGNSDLKEGMGSIIGHSREQSNVDVNNELVALIEQQRNYQASAQTFKILDQVLQNLANMRSN